MTSKVDVLTIQNKMLEAQIVQQVTSSSTPLGKFPRENELSLGEPCNPMILRGGKQLEEPKGLHQNEHSHYGNEVIGERGTHFF